MAPYLFEDIFSITRIDPDGKKFDKVSRIEAESDKYEAYILLDVNIDVYPIKKDKRYTIAIATTLDLDGTPDTGYYNQTSRETLADRFEYVMHGRTYRVADVEVDGQEKGEIYVSYGGLLMLLRVEKSVSKHFELDQRLFLLMKKTEQALDIDNQKDLAQQFLKQCIAEREREVQEQMLAYLRTTLTPELRSLI